MSKRMDVCKVIGEMNDGLIMKIQILQEIGTYIQGTYKQHYSTTEDGMQVQDMLRHLDIDKDFCQANAVKYLCRKNMVRKTVKTVKIY